MFYKSLVVTASGVLALSMTGCGSSSDKASSVKTSITTSAAAPSSPSTQVSPSSQKNTAIAPSSSAVASPTHSVVPAPTVSSHSAVAPKPVATHAAPVVAAAAPGTTCYTAYRSNGHEDWSASVGKNVSIPFCANVGKAARQAMDTMPDFGKYDIQAYSPTGKYITMHCESYDAGATCTGGNDAVVNIGLNTGF